MPLEDLTKRANFSKYDESVVKDMPELPGLALTSHVLLKCIQVRWCVYTAPELAVCIVAAAPCTTLPFNIPRLRPAAVQG